MAFEIRIGVTISPTNTEFMYIRAVVSICGIYIRNYFEFKYNLRWEFYHYLNIRAYFLTSTYMYRTILISFTFLIHVSNSKP